MRINKKICSLFILFLWSAIAKGQQADTVINMGIYKSYFCYALKNPLYVTYPLYKGGGDCDRSHFRFGACGVRTAMPADYAGSGFDEGHLANAEDFAGNCALDQKTFCFFNCLPQTTKLNRGIWKSWETKIRKLSRTQHLFIVAGGIYGSKVTKPGSAVAVPDFCYKVVLNGTGKKVIYCLLFPNDSSGQVQQIDLATLKQRLGYPLMP